MTAHSIPNATEGPQTAPQLPPFDDDVQDWHIMQCALDVGMDPYEAVRTARQLQRKRAQIQQVLGAEQGSGPAVTPAPRAMVGGMAPPPGFAGEVARFVFAQAPRPVAEVAIAAALGFLAGICGRQWVISGSGLNLYLVLVARSAVGKESMHRGVSKLLAACRKHFPMADQFVDFSDYASGQALIKGCSTCPCFINVVGEIGHKFYAMAKDTDPAMRTLRRQMTNLYSKSGPDAIAGGISYSSQDNNVASVEGVAYSLMGETTPAKFYESITADMMSDGFMSRFTVIEYAGERPDKNPSPLEQPGEAIVQHLTNLMQQAQTLSVKNSFQPVVCIGEAATLLNDFESECDRHINEHPDDESQRQMWNRAHLKALRIAALLAVADNCYSPTVGVDHAAWAIGLIRHDIGVFSKRIQSGEVGEGTDDGRERKLLQVMRDYLTTPPAASYKVPEALQRAGIIPRLYVQRRVSTLPAFANHRYGAVKAMDEALRSMASSGFIREVKEASLVDSYAFHGKAYAVLKLE